MLRTTIKYHTTIFDKILNKEIPSSRVYEDALVTQSQTQIYAFDDINPQAPVHVLIIPKVKDDLTGISKATDRHHHILAHMLLKVNHIATLKHLTHGYRLVINEGQDGLQTVQHLHIHLIGGRTLKWPPG